MILEYDSDNIPVFVCEKCGNKNLSWKNFYTDYMYRYKVKENWDSKKDEVSCILGFFCFKYKEFYSTDYIFVPKNINPFSSKECKDIRVLLASFKNNAHDVRRYIHWFFKNLTVKTKIVSIAYLNTPGIIRKYNLYVLSKNTLRRESFLPKTFLDWCKEHTPEVFDKYSLETMNDLGALLGFVKQNGDTLGFEKMIIKHAEVVGLVKNNNISVG